MSGLIAGSTVVIIAIVKLAQFQLKGTTDGFHVAFLAAFGILVFKCVRTVCDAMLGKAVLTYRDNYWLRHDLSREEQPFRYWLFVIVNVFITVIAIMLMTRL